MCNPRVYVGTYGKYNRGSIAGGWVSLRDCKDYRQFLSKCRALHRGERDPEYMIQDSEDFPDGLDCMEWLSEQDFNDVIAACKEEDEREPTLSIADQLRAALLARMGEATPKVNAAKPESEKTLLEEYMQEWQKVWPDDKSMLDYDRKRFSGAVRLQNGGILFFEKPSIDNRFCFRDEGPQNDFYHHMMADKETRLRDYFLEQNLAPYDNDIKRLSDKRDWADGHLHTDSGKTLYIQRVSYSGESAPLNLWRYIALHDWDVKNTPSVYPNIEPMTEADREVILEGVKRERDKFEKRLHTYLKRYGVSKIHTWTYWADA